GQRSIEAHCATTRKSCASGLGRPSSSPSSKQTVTDTGWLGSRRLSQRTRNYLASRIWRKRRNCALRFCIRSSFLVQPSRKKERQSQSAVSSLRFPLLKKRRISIAWHPAGNYRSI